MVLINCPECKREISDKAPHCPHCGYAVATMLIEETAKRWKVMQLIGGLVMFLGLIGCTVSHRIVYSSMVVIIGFGLYFYGRTMAWWHHG